MQLLVEEDALPFDPGFLEIDEHSDAKTGGLQVVDALRQMLVGKTFYTLQFYDEHVLNYQIGDIFAYVRPL